MSIFVPTANYLQASFLACFPRGRIWSRDYDSPIGLTAGVLVPTYARSAERAYNLTVDAFPKTTVELLPEWELTLGLPDPCAGLDPILSQRQQQVLARFIAGGGQSASYMVRYAANLGYPITVIPYGPARMGIATCGQPLNGEAWANAWAIHSVLQTAIVYATVGGSQCGDPLRSFGNSILECEMNRIKPAYTYLLFAYS